MTFKKPFCPLFQKSNVKTYDLPKEEKIISKIAMFDPSITFFHLIVFSPRRKLSKYKIYFALNDWQLILYFKFVQQRLIKNSRHLSSSPPMNCVGRLATPTMNCVGRHLKNYSTKLYMQESN